MNDAEEKYCALKKKHTTNNALTQNDKGGLWTIC